MLDRKLIESLKIQPVGTGWIDMICSPDRIDDFIDLCNSKNLSITGFTWWCHVIDGHEPCGMGGPVSKYYDGWFSEIEMGNVTILANNESYRKFFQEIWPLLSEYEPCHWPGFWLRD